MKIASTGFLASPQSDQALIREALQQLIANSPDKSETAHLEVKGWCKNAKELFEKMSESSSCLANGDGGVVILGVKEEVSVEERFGSCPYRDLNADLLSLKVVELTHPPVVNRVYDASAALRELVGRPDVCAYALIIPKSTSINGHMTTKGVSKIRVGKECKPNFTAEDDFTRRVIPGATVGQLSPNSINWAKAAHERAFRVPKDIWASDTEFLLQAGLLISHSKSDQEEPIYLVTLAALLLFGGPEAISKHVSYCETVLKTPVDTRTIRKNIVDSYRELCDARSGVIPSFCPDIGHAILKELVMNSYIHRCYRVASGVVITANPDEFTVQSPGELAASLNPASLIYCVPVYRNLLLAEGARFIGLCDKVGQGIDMVYRAVLSEGFEFPNFASDGGSFLASVPLKGSAQFREFVRKRSQSLTSLDEIAVIRNLYAHVESSFGELASSMQRGSDRAKKVLAEMVGKQMIESLGNGRYVLTGSLRSDIDNIFASNQIGLFG